MKALATRHDGSRPVSIAPAGAIGTGGLAVCDVAGYNYMDPQAEEFHHKNPDKPVMGTETVSAVGTRGIYVTDSKKGFVGSYDPYTTTGRASAEGWWRFCNARPWLSGGFVWTGFDYRGEPSPDQWPNISSQYGIVDTCGFPKDSFYYYQSWWTSKLVLHIFPHWNWPGMEGKEIAVWAYSNLDRVELFLNGRSLGERDVKKDSHVAWVVKYAPGSIEARGWKDGKLVMTTKRETTGRAAKLVLHSDRGAISADGEDVAMFSVEVQDAQGRTVPITDNEVTFQVSGAGKLIGVGNGDPTDHASDKGSSRKAFSGFCMALIQSSKEAGDITVEATSRGLAPASVTIAGKAVKLRPQVAVWERELPKGSGVTGLWRPVMPSGAPSDDFISMIVGANTLFVLKQDGDKLTGAAEGIAGFFGGDDVPSPIVEGTANGDQVAFKSLHSSFAGKIKGDQLELQRTVNLPWETTTPPQEESGRPAIGPAPDGSDPSTDPTWEVPSAIPVVLRRVQR